MQLTESPRAEGIRRLYELMLRVNSSTDLSEVLDEIARGVVEVLGYGIAAIARLEGETFVMTTVAGPEEVREQIIGRRTPVASIFNEFAQADEWGVLRFVPHDRMPDALEESAWVPDFEPGSGAGLLAPARRALRTAVLRHRPAARQHVGRPAARATGSRTGRSASCSRCSWCRRAWRCTTPSSASGSATRCGWATCCARSARPDSSPSSTCRCARRRRPSPRAADRAPVDPLLPLRRPRPGRAVGGVPARRPRVQPRAGQAQEHPRPAGPGSSAGRS